MLKNLRFAFIPAALTASVLLFGVMLPALPAAAQEGDGCALPANERMND
jgi:hypothetical protein